VLGEARGDGRAPELQIATHMSRPVGLEGSEAARKDTHRQKRDMRGQKQNSWLKKKEEEETANRNDIHCLTML